MNSTRSLMATLTLLVILGTAAPSLAADPKKALDAETTLAFLDTPLRDAMRFVSDKHDVAIKLADGVDADAPVSVNVKGIKLREAFGKLLRPLKLKVVVDGDHLLVRKPEARVED